MLFYLETGKLVLKGEISLILSGMLKTIFHLIYHLCQRMKESGNFNKDILTKEEFAKLLHDKIDTLDIKQAINEVKGFVKDVKVFDFWSKDYFRLLASRVVFSS